MHTVVISLLRCDDAVEEHLSEPPLVSEPLDVVVLVTDTNDNAPNFRRSSFEFRVAEELDSGQVC